MNPLADMPQRFREKVRVDAETGCWRWVGRRAANGHPYGVYWHDGKHRYAHRFAFESLTGPVPDGMVLDHFVCDTPECCNPAHVRVVTQRENTLRGDTPAARNLAKTRCPRGHALEGSNLYVYPRGGNRACRTCRSEARRRYKERSAA